MRKFIILFAVFATVISCKKDEKKGLTPQEQSDVDNIATIEYMKTHKFEDYHLGEMLNNIDWRIVPIDDNDTEDVVSLFDLMGENVISENINDVSYKMYYYIKDVGTGAPVKDTDKIRVDYNVFNIPKYEMSSRVDNSLFSVEFDIKGLIKGWQFGLTKFNSGVKPEGFPGDSKAPYRELVKNPGRGIILVPSGLAYRNGVLRFDIVVYENTAAVEE